MFFEYLMRRDKEIFEVCDVDRVVFCPYLFALYIKWKVTVLNQNYPPPPPPRPLLSLAHVTVVRLGQTNIFSDANTILLLFCLSSNGIGDGDLVVIFFVPFLNQLVSSPNSSRSPSVQASATVPRL